MQSRKVEFENADGSTLAARLDLPTNGAPVAYALFAHCFTCSKDLKAITNIDRALTDRGIGVLRFDFTGLGQSEGDFSDTSFATNIADLVAAAEFLGEHFAPPQLLIGHSLGGAATLHAAHQIESARAVATIAAPFDPEHVTSFLEESLDEIEEDGEATVSIAGRKFTVRRKFLEDLRDADPKKTIAELGKALLVLHSPVDEIVGIDNATDIFLAAKHPKSYVSLDRSDHLLSGEENSRYAGTVIAGWASKFIESEPQPRDTIGSDIDNQVVARIGTDHYRTDMIANGHSLVADEPVELGGTNFGPSPYDLLLASLGACTTMTLRMYADRKKWPLDRVTVRLDHEKVHRDDCLSCDDSTSQSRIDQIQRIVEVEGNLDANQRARLLEIADRCPVHRTLHGHIDVVTKGGDDE